MNTGAVAVEGIGCVRPLNAARTPGLVGSE